MAKLFDILVDKVSWPDVKCHVTYGFRKTPSNLASFLSETATFQISAKSVKTGGSYPGKRVFSPILLLVRGCFLSPLFLRCLLTYDRKKWYTYSLWNVLPLCLVWWCIVESHVTNVSTKSPCQMSKMSPRIWFPGLQDSHSSNLLDWNI